MTKYSEIFRRFKGKIEDNSLAMLSENDQNEQLLLWLDSAMSYIEIEGLKILNDLSDRDNILLQFNNTLTTSECELISLYMVVAWYDIRINSLEHTLMYYGTKDEKWTNQKDHLNAMIKTQTMYKTRARDLFIAYSAKHNSYLDGSE